MSLKLVMACLLLAGLSAGSLHTQNAPSAHAPNTQSMDISNLPKVELHLHLDCSLSYAVVKKLDPSITPEVYAHDFIAPTRCTNLADYISRAGREIVLMQTPEQLRLVTLDMFDQLKADHVIYAEIRFAPLQHLQKGLTPDQVVRIIDDAVTEGTRNTGIEVGVLLCTLRHYSSDESLQTVKLVEKFKGTRIVGFDIAADEAGYPIDNHIAAFQYAHAHAIPCTAHAGEAHGPKSVWEKLQNFHPSRIGHGVRSIEDPALVQYLKPNHIHLEICPTSNLQTNIYPTIDQHPVDSLYRAGVSLSINTDGRTISNTTLDKEYTQITDHFHPPVCRLLTSPPPETRKSAGAYTHMAPAKYPLPAAPPLHY